MSRDIFSLLLVSVSGFILAGLTFAAVQRRKGRGDHLLFWSLASHQQTSRLKRWATFRGTAAEFSRIFLVGAVFLIGLVGLIE